MTNQNQDKDFGKNRENDNRESKNAAIDRDSSVDSVKQDKDRRTNDSTLNSNADDRSTTASKSDNEEDSRW